MREIGAFEAQETIGTLLHWGASGEEVVITRRGKAVARLVSNQTSALSDKGLAAAARIRERAAGFKGQALGWEEWKKLRDEGRA